MSDPLPSVTPRVQPYYCPYCGEQDLWPEEEAGRFHCRLCDRRFEVRFHGLAGTVDDGSGEEA